MKIKRNIPRTRKRGTHRKGTITRTRTTQRKKHITMNIKTKKRGTIQITKRKRRLNYKHLQNERTYI